MKILVIAVVFLIAGFGVEAETAHSLQKKGAKLYQEKQYDAANKVFAKNIASAPEKPESYYNLGNTFFMQKQYDKAINAYQQTKEFTLNQEQLASLHEQLGVSFYKKGEYKESIKHYKESLRAHAKNKRVKAWLELAQKRLDEKEAQKDEFGDSPEKSKEKPASKEGEKEAAPGENRGEDKPEAQPDKSLNSSSTEAKKPSLQALLNRLDQVEESARKNIHQKNRSKQVTSDMDW